MKEVTELRVIFRGVLHNLRTSCVTVNTANLYGTNTALKCKHKQSLKEAIWKITGRWPWTHRSIENPLPIYLPFPNHRGVRTVWSTTNFNVARFAEHKVSKHANTTCRCARKTWKVSEHVNKTCSNRIVSKSTHEWPRVTTNDHEWPRVDHEWPRVTTSDHEWPRVTTVVYHLQG